MPDPGIFRTPPLQGWQRTNVVAAANCLREHLARMPDDARLRTAYEGLLDLLDPSRMLARRQRELAQAARQATPIKTERRHRDRRAADRRVANHGPSHAERRRVSDRRGTDQDRRRR